MRIHNLSSLLLILVARRNANSFTPRLTSSRRTLSLDWLRNRGGGVGANGSSTTNQFASVTSTSVTTDSNTSSSSSDTKTTTAVKDDDNDNHDSTTMIEQSLSIVGNNVQSATFGGVSYFNTACMPEFRVVFVLGGPGAGKGTQSALILEQGRYPCVHLSVGELLREEQNREDSPHRALIDECLVAGKIVPVEISLALLQRAMEQAAAERGRGLLFLVDGFPRNYDNLAGWNRCMKGIASVWAVLLYSCPLNVLEERILARAATSGRSDDNLQSAQKRFRTFEEQTVPVVNTLRDVQEILEQQQQEKNTNDNIASNSMALQVEDIQGDRPIDEVWTDTQSVMNKLLANDVWTANAKLIEAIETNNVEQYRSLCAYLDEQPSEDMSTHEGDAATVEISNATIQFETGTKAITSYDRVMEEGITTRETRVWSHEGVNGWRCIHFYRTPKQSEG